MQLNHIEPTNVAIMDAGKACVLINSQTGDFQLIDPELFALLSINASCQLRLTLQHRDLEVEKTGSLRNEKLALFPGHYPVTVAERRKSVVEALTRALAGVVNEEAIDELGRGLRLIGEINALIVEP